MKGGSTIGKILDVIACLKKAPRTIDELVEVTGIASDPVRKYVRAIEAEGLVVSEKLPRTGQGNSPTLYRWAP